eukprot:1025631-Pyramimonas_sp.AAC.1
MVLLSRVGACGRTGAAWAASVPSGCPRGPAETRQNPRAFHRRARSRVRVRRFVGQSRRQIGPRWPPWRPAEATSGNRLSSAGDSEMPA